ncbi:hypothetical protein D3C75_1327560 [compost metagenome]
MYDVESVSYLPNSQLKLKRNQHLTWLKEAGTTKYPAHPAHKLEVPYYLLAVRVNTGIGLRQAAKFQRHPD